MKRIKDRKLNAYFKDLIATQEIRINECGSEAYKSYIRPLAMSSETLYSIRRGGVHTYIKLPPIKTQQRI